MLRLTFFQCKTTQAGGNGNRSVLAYIWSGIGWFAPDPPFLAPEKNSSAFAHSGWALLQTHTSLSWRWSPSKVWSQRAHHCGNSPKQTQATSTVLPTLRSHVNPPPQKDVSRYSVKHSHFIHRNRSDVCLRLSGSARTQTLPFNCMSGFALNDLGVHLLCLCNY